jgi:hypothetical protein
MQFALLIYEPIEPWSERSKDGNSPYLAAWRVFYNALEEAGVHVAGEPLEVPETATTVRVRGGKRGVQDGPFAETKEQLAGFTILELGSLDEALDWAARCPAAAVGAVEVRPLAPDSRRLITG